MNQQSHVINIDGTYSRDFTYLENVIQANEKAILSENPEAVNTVFILAYGDRTYDNMLIYLLKQSLSKQDKVILDV
jgi:UDP-N-acetylglucosamine 4-epimerase